jgi:hypothetical protein
MVHFITVSVPENVESGQMFTWSISGQMDFGDIGTHLYVDIINPSGETVYHYEETFDIISYPNGLFSTSQKVSINRPGVYTFKAVIQSKLFVVFGQDEAERTINVQGNPDLSKGEVTTPQYPTISGLPGGLPEFGNIFNVIIMILVLWLIIQLVRK